MPWRIRTAAVAALHVFGWLASLSGIRMPGHPHTSYPVKRYSATTSGLMATPAAFNGYATTYLLLAVRQP